MNLEQALLNKLQEEAGEIVQAAAKCMQFTCAHRHHSYKDSNVERLEKEIGDALGIVKMLQALNIINATNAQLDEMANLKVNKTIHYLDVSHRMGAISDISLLTTPK